MEIVGVQMSQHFLLSPAARSLSLAKVARMSAEEAHNAFRLIRWADTKGEPVCPRCQCATYKYETRTSFRNARLARINSASRPVRSSPAASFRLEPTIWRSQSS
jgi:transposase-like zinc ribbon protein